MSVLTEVGHSAKVRFGTLARHAILDNVIAQALHMRFQVPEVSPDALKLAREVQRKYADLDLDLADAVNVTLAADYRTDVVISGQGSLWYRRASPRKRPREIISGAEFGAMSDHEATERIADVGVIARVTPEHKVRLVDVLQRKGQIVAMTGDGVNDAPALKKADIGVAMGEAGTEVARRAAVMILTDDNFSTITRAVELGRGLYDNLARYIRFETGCMFGFIITFLGASIFDIAHGEPLLPLQVLWVAFTTVTIQSIGLGYSNPAEGLMERRPRSPSEPILSREVLGWLVSVGLVMAVGTLSVISWAQQAHTLTIARTMGLVVFSLLNLFFSIEAKDERESAFSSSTFSDRTFVLTSGVSLFLLVMATVLGPCQAILKTTELDEGQWLICAAVALSVILASEIRKAVLPVWMSRKASPLR